jgi:hypothetical protein
MPIANPIAVYRAESNLEAELLCTYLGNNGIEAHSTWDESLAATWMFGNLPQVHSPQVWVDQTNVVAARPLLVEYEREQKLRREKNASQALKAGSIEVACEECGKTTSFAASKKGTTQDCSHCGAFVDVGDEEPFDWQSDS